MLGIGGDEGDDRVRDRERTEGKRKKRLTPLGPYAVGPTS